MTPLGDAGRTEQLTELLACVSSFRDVAGAAAPALGRALALLGADAGAIGWDGRVLAHAGLESCPPEVVRVLDGAVPEPPAQPAPGWHCVRTPLHPTSGWLTVTRGGSELSAGDRELLRLLGRMIGVALESVAALADERARRTHSERTAHERARQLAVLGERQDILERISRIQRAIVDRTSLKIVLGTILHDVTDLLDADIGALQLIDRDDPDHMRLVAGRGLPGEAWRDETMMPTAVGLAGKALASAEPVMTADYANEECAWPNARALGMHSAMAAPLWENGRVAGAFVVGSTKPERVYDDSDRDVLVAFAEQASLALGGASRLDSAVHRAYHDLLTGLPNRARFIERLAQAQARAQVTATRTAVLLLDLDGFKRVNDSLGHAAGDQLLLEIAGRLEDCLRPADTAARFGGDEFAILLEGLERDADATIVASRVLLALQEPVELAGRRLTVSASIGVAVAPGEGGDLLRDADLAMYRAKSAGKNRYEVFDESLHAVAMENLRLETQLQHAVAEGELVLHFQPIVSLGSGAIKGIEALVRWEHPERGLLGPNEFIPVAEQSRVICAIGRWVLNAACREALRWRRPGSRAATPAVSVNLSVTQLRQPGLIYEVAEALERSGLEPSSLILEVTETMLMDDVELMADTLAGLKRLGVQLAIDDFGTGYSSLEYLRRFPIDILKIAKPFVDGVDGGDSRLARVILELGKSLHLRVIAEGVERSSQAEALRRLGCRWGQGFLYARPMTAQDIQELLAAVRPRRASKGVRTLGGDSRSAGHGTRVVLGAAVK